MSGSGYYSQNDLRLHFGLGAAAKADMRRDRLAFGREGDVPGSARQPALRRPGIEGHRRQRKFGTAMRRCDCAPLVCVRFAAACWRPRRAATCSSPTSPQRSASTSRTRTPPPSNKYLLETMGGGVALLDYDNDGRLDMFFTNGAKIDDPMPDGKRPTSRTRDSGTASTTRMPTARSPTSRRRPASPACRRTATAWASRWATTTTTASRICTSPATAATRCTTTTATARSRDVTEQRGRRGGGWSASAGFFDYDNDGKLDLFVTRYVDWTFKKNRYCGEKKPGYRAYCHPDNYDGVTEHPLPQQRRRHVHGRVREGGHRRIADGKGLGVAFADYDGDGCMDIYVANDSVQCVPVPQQRQRHVHRSRACWPASASTRTARPSPAWAWTSPTTTTTAVPISWSPISPTSATCSSATTATAASGT